MFQWIALAFAMAEVITMAYYWIKKREPAPILVICGFSTLVLIFVMFQQTAVRRKRRLKRNLQSKATYAIIPVGKRKWRPCGQKGRTPERTVNTREGSPSFTAKSSVLG